MIIYLEQVVVARELDPGAFERLVAYVLRTAGEADARRLLRTHILPRGRA